MHRHIAHLLLAPQLFVTAWQEDAIAIIWHSGGSFRKAESIHRAPAKYTTVTHDRHGVAFATRYRNHPRISEVIHALRCELVRFVTMS